MDLRSLASGCSRLLCLGLLAAACAQRAGAEERDALLQQMRELAQATRVSVAGADKPAQLVEKPIFRYSDQPRRFIDATMWAWTEGGRPIAFQKIEAVEYGDEEAPSSSWQYCFTSASPGLLDVEWPGERRFRTKEAGIEIRPLLGAPAPAEGSLQRKRQARELVRKFSGRIVTSPKANTRQEMRLLTTPVFEFADPQSKEFHGAVFGLSTNGTNPDVLLLLEVRGDDAGDRAAWYFSPVRMTCCPVMLAYGQAEVWSVDWVNGTEAPFPAWTFFTTARPRVKTEGEP